MAETVKRLKDVQVKMSRSPQRSLKKKNATTESLEMAMILARME